MENAQNNIPNYYAVIPANVRYDKNLRDKAKLLYGEISSLCNKNGYCWASNSYFAELYGVSKTTISTLLKELADKNYITIKIIKKENSQEIESRHIYIVPIKEILNTPIKENLNTYLKNFKYPIKENLKDNNKNIIINNNNKNINKEKHTKENWERQFEEFWSIYPKKQNKKKTEIWFKNKKPNDKLFKKIIDRIQQLKDTKDWQKESGRYIPMPTTWLNGERWNDEVETKQDNIFLEIGKEESFFE